MPCSFNWYILINCNVLTKGKIYHIFLITCCDYLIQFLAIANDLKKTKEEARLQIAFSTKQLYFQKCEEIIQLKSSIIKMSYLVIFMSKNKIQIVCT